MNPLTKRLVALGASSVIAVSGAYMVSPWEGKENHAYKDIVGVATICFGETKGVNMGDYRTDEQCEESLVSELTAYNKAMKKHVKVDLKPYEEVAYTSLVWNIGETAFKNSKSVLQRLNSGDHEGACKGILDWNKATFTARQANVQIRNGETCTVKRDGMFSCTVKGLTNRRLDEYKTCTGNNPKVNEALHELYVSQNSPETFISTSQGVDEGEPVSTLIEPLDEPEISVPAVVPEAPVEKCWKFLWFCLK